MDGAMFDHQCTVLPNWVRDNVFDLKERFPHASKDHPESAASIVIHHGKGKRTVHSGHVTTSERGDLPDVMRLYFGNDVLAWLEEAFNKIATVEFMVDELNDAVSRNDTQQIVDISAALMAYLPVYLSHYERASRRAWNNTVVKVAESDVPYRNDTESGNEDNIQFKYNEEIELELETL